MTSLSWDAVLAWRLRRQHLAERAPRAAALDVVSDLGGLHAQVASSAELTLWARVEGLASRARSSGCCGRSGRSSRRGRCAGRCTSCAPTSWAATSARSRACRPRHHVPRLAARTTGWRARRPTRCSPPSRRCSTASRSRARRSRRAVAERVGERGARREARRRLRRPAQARGVHRRPLLRALRRAARPLHRAAPAGWTGFEPPGPDEAAAAAVVRAYLAAYGPAPREQFQRWFGMTSPAEAGRWIAALGEEVVEVDVEGAARLDARRRRRRRPPRRRAGGRRPAAAGLRPVRRRRAARRAGRARPTRTARPSTARRAGSRRSCWTTGGSPAPGSSSAGAARPRSR